MPYNQDPDQAPPRWEVEKMIADAIDKYDGTVGTRLVKIEGLLLQIKGVGWFIGGLCTLAGGIYAVARLTGHS